MHINYSEIAQQLKAWMAQYTFNAFVTLTTPRKVRPLYSIPTGYDLNVSSYLIAVEKELAVPVAAMGLHTLSYGGFIHSHFVAFKENKCGFSPDELRLFEQRWAFQAAAQEVTRQDTLIDYIASEKHMQNCRNFDYLLFGDDVLQKETSSP